MSYGIPFGYASHKDILRIRGALKVNYVKPNKLVPDLSSSRSYQTKLFHHDMFAWHHCAAFSAAAFGHVSAYTPGVDFLDGIDGSCVSEIQSEYSTCSSIIWNQYPDQTGFTVQDVVNDAVLSQPQSSGSCFQEQQGCLNDHNPDTASCYQACNPFACCLGELQYLGLCTTLELQKQYPCVKVLPCYQACDKAQAEAEQPCYDLANQCLQKSVDEGCVAARRDYSCSGRFTSSIATISAPETEVITSPTSFASSSASSSSTSSASTTCTSSKPSDCTNSYRSGRCAAGVSTQCKAAGKSLVSRGIVPATNGCGAEADDFVNTAVRAGLVVIAADFRLCCNNHDTCFGTCAMGDDSQYEVCNSKFLSCMLAICQLGALVPVPLIAGSCVSRAALVYAGVQFTPQSCVAYGSAQDQACECVDCPSSGSAGHSPNKIVESSPLLDAIGMTCSTVSTISGNWIGFVEAFRRTLAIAEPSDQAILQYYGGVLGTESTTTSDQIGSVSKACRSQLRIRGLPPRRREIKLSTFFAGIANIDLADYVCRANDQEDCVVAQAIITVAGLARKVESYANGIVSSSSSLSAVSSTSAPGSTTSSLPTDVSSTTRSISTSSEAITTSASSTTNIDSVIPSSFSEASMPIAMSSSSTDETSRSTSSAPSATSADAQASPSASEIVPPSASATVATFSSRPSIVATASSEPSIKDSTSPGAQFLTSTTASSTAASLPTLTVSLSTDHTSPHTSAFVALHPYGDEAYCLDVAGNDQNNGTRVQLYKCNGSGAQKWVIRRGRTKVQLYGTEYCLDAGLGPADFTQLKVWKCFDGLFDQDYYYTDDDRVALTDRGLCMDLQGGVKADEANVQLYQCTDWNTNQIWTVSM